MSFPHSPFPPVPQPQRAPFKGQHKVSCVQLYLKDYERRRDRITLDGLSLVVCFGSFTALCTWWLTDIFIDFVLWLFR